MSQKNKPIVFIQNIMHSKMFVRKVINTTELTRSFFYVIIKLCNSTYVIS